MLKKYRILMRPSETNDGTYYCIAQERCCLFFWIGIAYTYSSKSWNECLRYLKKYLDIEDKKKKKIMGYFTKKEVLEVQ